MEHDQSESVSASRLGAFNNQDLFADQARFGHQQSEYDSGADSSAIAGDSCTDMSPGTGADINENCEQVTLCSIWVSMPNGEQLHLRQFIPAGAIGDAADRRTDDTISAAGRTVFMLHGEAECGRIFYNNQGKGLAWHLVNQGYQVFVADLGGRGRSLVAEGVTSSLTVQDIVTTAIPRFLQAVEENSIWARAAGSLARGPDIWVGHGFGSVLLAAAWARLDQQWRSASQMVFIAGRRQLQARQPAARAFVKLFCHPLTQRLVDWKNLFPATRLGLGTADENASWYRNYVDWMHAGRWHSTEDRFDYAGALAKAPVPPTLHIAAGSDVVYSNIQDVRRFIGELGQHDARLLVLDSIAESRRQYNHLSLLLDPAAVGDVFEPLTDWLDDAILDAGLLNGNSAISDRNERDFGSFAPAADQQPGSSRQDAALFA